ncbi:MAG TPA: putative quinol monooxygenase [Anaerolineae bacterium]|nr:putative quinol monooxygenase [Anaerolineae bacterium]
MPCHVIVEFQAAPAQAEALKALLKEALPDTRAYDGCQSLSEYHNQEDAGNIVLVESWVSREHYDKYLNWRVESGMLDKVGPLLTGEPSIRYYDVAD